MTFTQAIRSALGKYVTFSGRATRSEYWWFYLFTILVSLGTSGADAVLSSASGNETGIVNTVASLVLFLPSLAVTARRLHDTGRTGWWMLLPVVPVLATVVVGITAVFTIVFTAFSGRDDVSTAPAIGAIALLIGCGLIALAAVITLLVFLCLDSQPGPNKYGPSPKQPMPPSAPYGYAQPYGYPVQPPAPPGSGPDRPQH